MKVSALADQRNLLAVDAVGTPVTAHRRQPRVYRHRSDVGAVFGRVDEAAGR